MDRSRSKNNVARIFSLLLMLLAASTSRVGGAEPAAEPLREFPPATVVAGHPEERGRAYGEQSREAIRDFLQKEVYAPFAGQPATKEQMLSFAAACGNVVRDQCPMIAEEFQGIADGAGITFAEVMLINLHEELYHRTELPYHGHCTAVAVGPTGAGNEHTYVGQTWDWMQSVAGKSQVIEWRRGDGASVLAYGFPGMPMGAGVSSEGIALCWTSAALGNNTGQSPRVGIPSYVLIAHLLSQKDLDGVIREARKNKHAGWFTFVLADGDGRLVNLEGSPEGIAVEEAEGHLVRVDYGSRQMTGVEPGGQVPFHSRCQKMYDLLDASRGSNDLAQLQTYLADPAYSINAGESTIDMMVFDTTARSAWLSRGTSYKLAWREFGFGERD
jgi:isopenicillin-N N-acyltransferase-like protein